MNHKNSILKQAEINIEIQGPLARTCLKQYFENTTDDIIEAIYNFPIPKQAVIMNVKVMINDEVFKGQIQAIKQAEDTYDSGVESGKRSIIIRDLGDGQQELRAGNLAPNDRLVIEIEIAQCLQFHPSGFRYFLPTVIAPKYGHATDFHDIAHKHSILADYAFDAHVHIHDEATVTNISHNIQKIDAQHYSFTGKLNQDIVLNISSVISKPYLLSAVEGEYPSAMAVIAPV